MKGETRRIRLIIRGRVQGVWYRGSAQEIARELGLTGWVRNLSDGSVELIAEGESSALEALKAWCLEGPPLARVYDVLEERLKPCGEPATFEVR
ncbi:MAG: acylphosphatase [Nitrospinae bacterium]|nr:acylphosphatase [Nitrospinota bacterium]